jgi:hypothetical protein
MWHIDRNHQRPNEASDSIPIFMQHDFKSFKDNNGQIIYSVLSNGDSSRPFTTAYQFTVKQNASQQPVFKIIGKLEPKDTVPNTGAGGNYDVYTNGNYLINYGAFTGDSLHYRLLFEYRDKNDSILAQYKVPQRIICYRVHQMFNHSFVQPIIKVADGYLQAANEAKQHKWYRLYGAGNMSATEVGSGNKYKPTESGTYCFTEKYGIGYLVSKPVVFQK